MKENEQNQPIPLPTLAVAVCAAVVAFLHAPLLGKLALAVIASVIAYHATRNWKTPHWLRGHHPNKEKHRKGGEPKW